MAVALSYRKAIELGCFLQLPLFGAEALRNAAAARGLLDFPHAVNWESLDREGFLPPVAYTRQPLPAELHLAGLCAGDLILRDGHGYAGWRQNELSPLYAHWQLLSLAELHESLSGRSPLVILAGGSAQLSEELARRADWLKDPGYPGRVAHGQRDLELLLARTQSLFMPVVRRSYRVSAMFDHDGERLDLDTRQWAIRERSELDYPRAAKECGVTADEIAGRYDALMTKAERLDPLKEWRDLVDQVERRKIEALGGQALRAQDLYDAAEVLRLWYRRLTERDLRKERDASIYFGPDRRTVNKQLYGFEELRGNRAALPGILDRFGTYPWKAMLITEGEGDVAMLEAIVSHHTGGATFEQLGIVPHVMKGTPRKRDQRVQELLAALRRFPNYFLLVFDREGTAVQWASRLEQYKPSHSPFGDTPVLEPEPEAVRESPLPEGWSGDAYVPKRRPEVEIWAVDIEADNFSEAEISEVICRLAKRDDRIGEFSLPPEELSEAGRQSNKAIAALALELAEARGFRLGKVELDAELGRYAAQHPQRDGVNRRVLIVAEHLYRLTVAHRQMRGRLREREREALRGKESGGSDSATA
jgi:hypothetical protein